MNIISIVIPVYNEEDNIPILYQKLLNIADNSDYTFEFIFTDDCSMDRSFHILQGISLKDSRVKVIKFSRNFGSHAACLAGLMNSKGDACVFISADMQEPPELIQSLIKGWENGNEIVMGIREGEGAINFFSKIYYTLVRSFALENMPRKGTDFFLIDRKVLNTIISIKEKNTSIFGLLIWSGFKQAFISYNRKRREIGISKWTLRKKIKLFIDTFISFSYFPIRLISLIGITFAFAGFLYAMVVIFNRVYFEKVIEGWASLMVVLLVVSGIQMLMLGILGEYLWRSFDESRNRPPFIITQTIGFQEKKKEQQISNIV